MKFFGPPGLLLRLSPPIYRGYAKRDITHVRFDDEGIIETEIPRLIQRLKGKYPSDDPDHLADMTVAQLKIIAKNEGIVLGKKNKTELIDEIKSKREVK